MRRPFKPWLKTITHRVVRDHLALGRNSWEDSVEDEHHAERPDPLQDPERDSENSRGASILHELLEQLDPDVRAVFTLAEFHELTYPEIAAELGIAESTVQSRLRRGQRDFQRVFDRWVASERRRMAEARAATRYCSAKPMLSGAGVAQGKWRSPSNAASAGSSARKPKRGGTKLLNPMEMLLRDLAALTRRAERALDGPLTTTADVALVSWVAKGLRAARMLHGRANDGHGTLVFAYRAEDTASLPLLFLHREPAAQVIDLAAHRRKRQRTMGAAR